MVCALKRDQARPECQVETVEWSERMKSVLLPFKTASVPSKDVSVEWRRVFPKNVLVLGYQLGPHWEGSLRGEFTGRADMKPDLLRTGDLTLALKNPSGDDCGLYSCTVLRDGGILRQKAVDLTGVTGSRRLMGTVEVREGERSVLLPFTTTPSLAGNVTVRWSRHPFGSDHVVHAYRTGHSNPDRQHVAFRGRTKMQENLQGTGDLSLTLSDPSCDDRGFYLCTLTVDGRVLKQKVVALSVRETLMGTVRGVFRCCPKKGGNATNPAPDKTDLLPNTDV